MQDYLIWVVAGFALVIIELMTGTFYLLVLGIGAFAGALAAFLGLPFFVQVLVAGAVALAGCWWVHRWHKANNRHPERANALDTGQSVVFEHWINEPGGIARVRYRGADWDAHVQDADRGGIAKGSVLYITEQDGQTWIVSSARRTA